MLIEREKPLKQLTELAKQAATGRGAIALVSGEAGLGKTSMLEEMRLSVGRDCKVIWGGCDALFTPRALGPIHDMSSALGDEVNELLNSGAPSSQLFAAVLRRIEASDNATLMVFEDVHWADNATLDFLKFIGRRVSMLRVMLVMSYRDDEISTDHPLTQVLGELPHACTTRVDILPLTATGVSALSAQSNYAADEIYTITGGNPFFVTELLAGREDFHEALPASIKDAVASRLSHLGQLEREFLETISIIPGSVSPEIIELLFGESGDTFAMACVGRNLLMQDVNQTLRFRHELARLATLSRVSISAQKTLHARVFNALQQGAQESAYDQLVHHAAGAMDAKNVLKYAPLAAEIAASVGSHREAAAHLSTALRFIDEAEPETAALLYESWAYEAGLALRINDEVLEARRHAITLWRALKRMDKVGDNLRWLSRLHWYRGESVEATHFADEAVRVLGDTPPSAERAMAYSLRSQLHMLNDQMDDAIEWGERALKLADQFGVTEVRIHALNNIGTANIFRDKPEGIELLEQSLALALQHGHHEHAARVYTNLAEYGVDFRNFELAERIISDGIAYDTLHDLDAWTHYLVGRLAQLRMEQGRLRDAETIAVGVLELDRLTLLMQLPALTVLAKVRTRLGAHDALQLANKALQDAVATNEVQHIIPARFCLLELAWLNDSLEVAREHLDELASIDTSELHTWNVGDLAVWAQRLDVTLSKSVARALPNPHQLELDGKANEAADAWQTLGLPYAAAMTLLAAKNRTDTDSIATAIKLLDPIEARAASDKARTMARALGVTSKMPRARRGPYKSARNHPLGLTKREQAVLKLLADGCSNREISEMLNRSPRTIEHHVSSLLGKLNVANRMEAMLRVQNEPWLLPK